MTKTLKRRSKEKRSKIMTLPPKQWRNHALSGKTRRIGGNLDNRANWTDHQRTGFDRVANALDIPVLQKLLAGFLWLAFTLIRGDYFMP